jgi:hypothetical protein
MLKKIAKILLIIMVVILLDFIVSFAIDYLFGKHTYLNRSFVIYLNHDWISTGLVSLLAVGGTAFFYLFFYTSIVGTKYGQFYKNHGGILVFILMAFCFMGSMIFAFTTSFFAVTNFLRLCGSAWLVTYWITKIMEEKAPKPENFEK